MDSSFTIKPRDSASRALHDRTSIVRTQLSPSQSVTAPSTVSPPRHDMPDPTFGPRPSTIDPQTQSAIQREQDQRRRPRGKPTAQALSRMQAYRSAPVQDAGDATDHTDFEV